MFTKIKSLKVNTCPKVFVVEIFVQVQPMPVKADTGILLRVFSEDVGVPNYIVLDGAKEQTGPNSAFMQTMRQLKMKIHNTEPY